MGARRQRKEKQLDLKLKKRFGHGGARKNAGRKRTTKLPRVGHERRSCVPEEKKTAVHITWRVLPEVFNLRSDRSFRALLRGFVPAASRFGTRITRFSVQGNHIHLVAETEGRTALARAMQGLAIRLARALNRVMKRKGSVFADRYHARPLISPRDAWNAIQYVMRNHAVHAARQGRSTSDAPDRFAIGPEQSADPNAYWRRLVAVPDPPIARPEGWLLSAGWLRGAPRAASSKA